MPKAKTINIKLLREVAKHITKYPENFDQDETLDEEAFTCPVHKADKESPCGTRACVGGWAYFLSTSAAKRRRDDEMGTSILDVAAEKLNLTEEQAERLFSGIGMALHGHSNELCWPIKFDEAYERAATAKQRAKVAVKRIEHFIKTNGAE